MNPNQPYCRFVVAPKVKKFRKAFKNQVKEDQLKEDRVKTMRQPRARRWF